MWNVKIFEPAWLAVMCEQGLTDQEIVTTLRQPDIEPQPEPAPLAQWAGPGEPIADTPVLGLGTLLEIFDGDRAGVDELVDVALASIHTDSNRVVKAATTGDSKTLVEAAHKVKGTSGSLRSLRLAEASAALQQAGKDPHKPDTTAMLVELRAAVDELKAEVARTRRAPQATP